MKRRHKSPKPETTKFSIKSYNWEAKFEILDYELDRFVRAYISEMMDPKVIDLAKPFLMALLKVEKRPEKRRTSRKNHSQNGGSLDGA